MNTPSVVSGEKLISDKYNTSNLPRVIRPDLARPLVEIALGTFNCVFQAQDESESDIVGNILDEALHNAKKTLPQGTCTCTVPAMKDKHQLEERFPDKLI